MGWRDRLQRASFKGADFWVEELATRKGRRTPIRKLAGRDGSVQQDLGEEPHEFDITAYLFGEDYDLDRDDLEQKLTEKGPAALCLPTRGELWVRVVRGPDTNERRTEGGYCTIRFGVVLEDRDSGSLRSRPDTASDLKVKAATLRTVAAADLKATYDTTSLPDKYLRTTRDAIGTVTSTLRVAQRNIQGALAVVDNVTSAINELDNAVNVVMSSPSLLATTLVDLVGSVLQLADTAIDNIDRTTGLAKLLESPYEQSASVRATAAAAGRFQGLGSTAGEGGESDLSQRAAENTRSVFRLTRAAALATQAETYAAAPFDSSTLAIAVLVAMRGEIDALGQYGASDDLYQSLADLRAAAAAHLLRSAASLPEAIEYTPKRELPALLIAHDLYADARQEAEIVSRNRVPHPCFVFGTLEVIAP
ncbi:MAG TPA: DNA circularization N-terminal domain-containing protein [Polyangiales bacterium]|nr:DNA circularization N-terminal domain-containing protein [Polyangiales bacterium]